MIHLLLYASQTNSFALPIFFIFYCRAVYANERTLLRARFDKHKTETDPERATQLLRLGEEEFWENQHPLPMYFSNEPGGVAWERPVKYQVCSKKVKSWP